MDSSLIAHVLNFIGSAVMVLMAHRVGQRYETPFFRAWVLGFTCFAVIPAGELLIAFVGRSLPISMLEAAGATASAWYFIEAGSLIKRAPPLPAWVRAFFLGVGAVSVTLLAAGVTYDSAAPLVFSLTTMAMVRLGWVFLRQLPPDEVAPGAAWVGWTAILLGTWPFLFPFPVFAHTRWAWIGFGGAGLLQILMAVSMLLYVAEVSWARYKRAQDQVAQVRNEFVSVVGHELRSPLTAVIGYAELLEEVEVVGPLSPLQREYLAEIQRGGNRLRRLVDDLLDYSLAENGALRLDCRPSNLNERLAAVIDGQRLMAARAELTLTLALPDAPLIATLDPDRLEQVVLNLIGNAFKFTPAGGEVSVTLRADGEVGVITVSDNGVGIEPAALPQLFDKFFQGAPGSQRNRGGAGLGLAVAKAITEAHGGTIVAQSEPGRGAEFEVRLRLDAPAAASTERRSSLIVD